MCGIEIELVLASRLNLTCFFCGGQNRLRLCVRAADCLVLIYGSKLPCFVAWGSNLTSVLFAGRKSLSFYFWIEIVLDFRVEIEKFFVAVCGPKMTCF